MSTLYSNLYSVPAGTPVGQTTGVVPPQLQHLVRYPFVFLIDTSGSTGQGPDPDINHINAAIQQLIQNLKNPPPSSPLRHQNKQVDVCILAYNSTTTIIQDWALVDQIPASLPVMSPTGGTAMGRALKDAIRKIRERHADYRTNAISSGRCHIVHITDGEPTDMSPGDPTWNAITQDIYKLDGTADPENRKAAMIHYCSPRGMTAGGLQNLQQLSGQKSVYALGTEVQNFDQMVEMVTGIITFVTGSTRSETAISDAAARANISTTLPITSPNSGYATSVPLP